MTGAPSRFHALARLAELAALAGDEKAVLVVDRAGHQLLWANGAGLAALGIRSAGQLAVAGFGAASPTARRLATLAGQIGAEQRLERLPLPVGIVPTLAVCQVRRLVHEGERLLIVTVVDGTGRARSPEAAAAAYRAVAGGEARLPAEDPLPTAVAPGNDNGPSRPAPEADVAAPDNAADDAGIIVDMEPADGDTSGPDTAAAEAGLPAGDAPDGSVTPATTADGESGVRMAADPAPAEAIEAGTALDPSPADATATDAMNPAAPGTADLPALQPAAMARPETGGTQAIAEQHPAVLSEPEATEHAEAAEAAASPQETSPPAVLPEPEAAEAAASPQETSPPAVLPEPEVAEHAEVAEAEASPQETSTPAGLSEPEATERAEVAEAVAPSPGPAFAFPDHGRTVRFLFELDDRLAFAFVSPDLGETVGPAAATLAGETWDAIARRFALDPLGRIAAALGRKDTFTGLTVDWPVEGAALRVPVDLAGMPVVSRDRRFRGYRGFGLIKTAAAFPAAVPPLEPADAMPAIGAGADPAPVPPAADPAGAVADGAPARDAANEAPHAPVPVTEGSSTDDGPGDVATPSAAAFPPLPPEDDADDIAALARLDGTTETGASESGEEPAATAVDAAAPDSDRQAAAEPDDTGDARQPSGVPAAAFAEAGADAGGDPAASNVAADGAETDDGPWAGIAGAGSEPDLLPPEDDADDIAALMLLDGTTETGVAEHAARGEETNAVDAAAPATDDTSQDAEIPAEAALHQTEAADAADTGAADTVAGGDDADGAEALQADASGTEADDADGAEVLPADASGTEADDELVWRDRPASADVILSPIVPRAVPPAIISDQEAGRLQLSRPEREAFQKIAEALGARYEDQAGTSAAAPAASTPAGATTAAPSGEPGFRLGSMPIGASTPPLPPPPARAPMVETEAVSLDLSILDRMPVAVAILKDGEALAVNRAFLDLSGYPTFEALMAAGGFAETFAGSPLPRDTSLPAIRRADGTEVPVSARLHSIGWGPGVASLMVLQETAITTGRDRAEQAEGRVAEMEAILDVATDGVLVLDGEGTVVGANRSAEALFGQERATMTGAPLIDLLAPESHRSALDYLDGLARNGVASVLNDGREVIGKVGRGGLVPLFMTMGRVAPGRFCAVLRDITQWKRAEEELTAAKRSAETASSQKSDFLAKISHEIRTPLNAIIGFSEVMMEERFGPVGSDRYKEYLRDIHLSGAHIMSLVNDLLDLSKIEAGKLDLTFEAVATNEIVRECVALMQPQANRERVIIRTSLSSSLPNVVADSRSLRQIILNLVSNAVKFNVPGGQVIVSTLYEDNGEVSIRVRDTGSGMSAEDMVKALEPFRQLHTARPGRGTGLGLPLTKALVEANRASFRLDSAVGQGTLVQVTFPSTRVLAE